MSDYRWWLTGDPLPSGWLAVVKQSVHAGGAENDECACESGDEHQFMVEGLSDDAVYALEAAAPLVAAAERARIQDQLTGWKCSCGADDCSAYDARDEIASMIEGE